MTTKTFLFIGTIALVGYIVKANDCGFYSYLPDGGAIPMGGCYYEGKDSNVKFSCGESGKTIIEEQYYATSPACKGEPEQTLVFNVSSCDGSDHKCNCGTGFEAQCDYVNITGHDKETNNLTLKYDLIVNQCIRHGPRAKLYQCNGKKVYEYDYDTVALCKLRIGASGGLWNVSEHYTDSWKIEVSCHSAVQWTTPEPTTPSPTPEIPIPSTTENNGHMIGVRGILCVFLIYAITI